MKIFAFHSYKGGAGRTLALVNFALALRRKNHQKVLMIDLDFDAPGLPYKFGKQNEVKGGYVTYLASTTPSERADGTHRRERLELIQDLLVRIDDNLLLLPAGDPGRVAYWRQLESSEFQRSFAISEESLPSQREKVALTDHENWRAFKRDIEDIRAAAGNPDYCLIDCKTARESVAVPLLAWADHIVEFMACNREGVFGTLMLQKMLEANELRPVPPILTPVMTRVPYGTTRQYIEAIIERTEHELRGSFIGDVEFPMKRLQIIVEQREVEIGDVIVLGDEGARALSISFNYADLFEFVENKSKKEDKERENYRVLLGLDQQDEIVERYFRYSFRHGELINRDKQSNVALRRETLVHLINSLAADQSAVLEERGVPKELRDKDIASAFESAGARAGQSFGREAVTVPEVWENKLIPETTLERLRQWCSFERAAGFGEWTADYQVETRRGEVVFDNHFLQNTHGALGFAFLKGYILGVLGHLVGDIGGVARIRVTREEPTRIEFLHEG